MRILYLIFVVCVGALLWAAFAAASHIRRHESQAQGTSDEKNPDAQTMDARSEALNKNQPQSR